MAKLYLYALMSEALGSGTSVSADVTLSSLWRLAAREVAIIGDWMLLDVIKIVGCESGRDQQCTKNSSVTV